MQPTGWVLVLPDPEDPIMHVWSEGDTDAEARQLAQERVRAVRQALR
jgi:phosphomannomutase